MGQDLKVDESRPIRHYMYRPTQREGFTELWRTWKERWGEIGAADALLASMCDFESRYQDLKELVAERRKRKKNARTKD